MKVNVLNPSLLLYIYLVLYLSTCKSRNKRAIKAFAVKVIYKLLFKAIAGSMKPTDRMLCRPTLIRRVTASLNQSVHQNVNINTSLKLFHLEFYFPDR